jgi:hypothetical protein
MEATTRKLDWVWWSIIGLGIGLRLTLWWVNPPNNTFDDHLEPIAYYLNEHRRPAPGACWECYQPPLYYLLAAGVYRAFFAWQHSYYAAWKAVQAINMMLSAATLVLVGQLIRRGFAQQRLIALLLLAIAVVLPRDLYAASMITNDYLLVFLATGCIWSYLRFRNRQRIADLVGVCGLAAAAALTKQHGLILLIMPGSIFLHQFLHLGKQTVGYQVVLTILLPCLAIGIGLSDEWWKYHLTHQVLVSNQSFFDYANAQPPGSIARTDFHSLQVGALYAHPLLDKATWSSFWTVLFAGTWFDYEHRFTSAKLPNLQLVAGALYSYGLLLFGLTLAGAASLALRAGRQRPHLKGTIVVLTLVAVSFCLVPLVQTLRLPHFSSMKSQFILPATSLLLFALGRSLHAVGLARAPRVAYLFVGITLVLGIVHVAYVVANLPQALGNLSGPLWQFPGLRF